jgi:hypothetical protein
MKVQDFSRIERDATAKLNRAFRRYGQSLPYRNLLMIYNYHLANAETRRLVRAEAKRRGYKLARFGG